MNPLSQTFLTSESIELIAKTFFDRYKNPETNSIDSENAQRLIRDVYLSMGIESCSQPHEGNDMVEHFGSNKKEIKLEDLQRTFTRYLGGNKKLNQTVGFSVMPSNPQLAPMTIVDRKNTGLNPGLIN